VGADCNGVNSLAFPTDTAVFHVFKDYTTRRKLRADFIAAFEISRTTGFLPLVDERFDLRVANPRALLREAERLKLGVISVFEHREDFIEFPQRRENDRHIRLTKFAAIDCRVDIAHEIEHSGKGLRGVQIVRQPLVEFVFARLNARRDFWRIACRKTSRFDARLEVSQPLD
jgi:hypothetical protein